MVEIQSSHAHEASVRLEDQITTFYRQEHKLEKPPPKRIVVPAFCTVDIPRSSYVLRLDWATKFEL
jgi:hypothetical protein